MKRAQPIVDCARCGQPFEKTNGRKKYCTPCGPLAERERARSRAVELAPQKKEYMAAWRAENTDKVLEYSRSYRFARRDRHIGDLVPCTDCGSEFVLNAARRVRCADCATKHRQSRAVEQAAKWNRENSTRRQARLNERYHADPATKLNALMASGIGDTLRGAKGRRKWQDLVGYTTAELKSHLEARFLPGMSWDNHAMDGWHIDHVRPKASFTFSTAEDPEFIECWGLQNLQPLWAEDNLHKNAKWTPPSAANDNETSTWQANTSSASSDSAGF